MNPHAVDGSAPEGRAARETAARLTVGISEDGRRDILVPWDGLQRDRGGLAPVPEHGRVLPVATNAMEDPVARRLRSTVNGLSQSATVPAEIDGPAGASDTFLGAGTLKVLGAAGALYDNSRWPRPLLVVEPFLSERSLSRDLLG